jgi:hypothetical protein
MRISRRLQIHPLRAAFWLIAVMLGLGALLDRHPFELSAGNPEVVGRSEPIDARGEFLVVVSSAAIADANARGDFEASWAWADLIAQEVGPVALIEASNFAPERVQGRHTIIATRSACADPALAEHIAELDAFVANGGTLVLELPRDILRERFAADGAGGWREPTAITAVDGVPDAVAEAIRHVPVVTRFMGSTRPLEGATTHFAMDGAPVIYSRAAGAGRIVVFDFDVGAWIVSLQQGIAGPGHRVRARRDDRPILTSDLVATSSTFNTTVPGADLLERYIVHGVIGAVRPVVALSPFPAGTRGALLTSHDVGHIDGRPLWMSVHERSLEARSSTFVAAPPQPPVDGWVINDAEHVSHAALLWSLDPTDARLYRYWGVFGFNPLRQPLTLTGQLEQLEAWLGEEAQVRGVRIAGGRWTEDFTAPYRMMDAVELRYSVSYGPEDGGAAGFLFGTCQPFTPLDSSGLPFRVQEIPICFENPSSDEERALLTQTLQTASTDGWAVHLLTSADSFRRSPSMAEFDAWRDALAFAETNAMWVAGAGEYLRFQRDRAASDVHVASVEALSRDADGEPTSVRYVIEAETSARDMALLVPVVVGGLRLELLERGNATTQIRGVAGPVESTPFAWLGLEYQQVALNPGFTTIAARYER